MKLRVLWFGRPAASPYEGEVETYRRRVSRRWPAEDVPLKPHAGGRDDDPRRSLAAEARSAAEQAPAGWPVVALDEGGRALDSVAFAELLGGFESRGLPGIVFVVGSDLGLDRELAASAALRLSLGPLTLPHLLARLVLWEQLFRATHILGGGGYHRQGLQ